MSVAHPWLEQEPWPTAVMPREMLEKRIERVLTMTNIGYLGTVRKDGSPIVSPIEFYADGFTSAEGFSLYVFPQPKSPKAYAIKRDPRVAMAIANPMAGWACVMGCQFFGTAKLLDVDTPEWKHGMKVFKWQASSAELGRALDAGAAGAAGAYRCRAHRLHRAPDAQGRLCAPTDLDCGRKRNEGRAGR